MKAYGDYTWLHAGGDKPTTIKDAISAAKWATSEDTVIYVHETTRSRYYLIPSSRMMEKALDQPTLDRVLAHYVCRFLGHPSTDWGSWEHFRDVTSNVHIIDATEEFACTCYKTKYLRVCEHSLGVRLLEQGYLDLRDGRSSIEDLVSFAPCSRGRPR